MSSPETILEAIKRSREVRDRIMLQNAIPVLDNLRNMVNTWIDDEFKDFTEEIDQVDCSAPRESASHRIDRFRVEINQIRNNQLPQAMKELDCLVEGLKQQNFKSAEDAIEMLKAKIPPILIVMWDLFKARERLDGMADMIPIPEPIEIVEDNPDNQD
jgi:hypothetical protein